jgi:hypothetical protein
VNAVEQMTRLQDQLKRELHPRVQVLTEDQELTVKRLEEIIPSDEYQAAVIQEALTLVQHLEHQISAHRTRGWSDR